MDDLKHLITKKLHLLSQFHEHRSPALTDPTPLLAQIAIHRRREKTEDLT
jgi:hypothetical protein